MATIPDAVLEILPFCFCGREGNRMIGKGNKMIGTFFCQDNKCPDHNDKMYFCDRCSYEKKFHKGHDHINIYMHTIFYFIPKWEKLKKKFNSTKENILI
jgi:hypothetical protein